MQTTFLENPVDMQWLSEVHYKAAYQYKCAIVYGNMDAPDKIELYARNNVDCKPTILQADAKGDLHVMQYGELAGY